MLPSFFGRFAQDLGIDLGTANTLVWVQKRGVILSEPSVVAIDKVRNQVVAVGEDARAMIGRTPPHIVTVRPLKDGVIADFEVAREMLKHFILRVHRGRTFTSPRVMIGVPSGITEVEKRAVMQAASRTGARAARIIEEPMAAAFGADLPVDEPTGSMIVDIGGGTTEVAVISLGGIVVGASSRTAGEEITEAIMHYLRHQHNLLVGENTAERLKMEAASAHKVIPDSQILVRGRNLVSGLPTALPLSTGELREAIQDPVREIIELVRGALENAPPELISDVIERGITLAGGGAMLRGLDTAISEAVQTPVHIAANPLWCVALGTGKALERWKD